MAIRNGQADPADAKCAGCPSGDRREDPDTRREAQQKPAPEGVDGSQEYWITESLRASLRWDVLSLVPLVAIVALVALVAALVWIVGRSDAERAQAKLATDALWVEQTLRFQMSIDEDMLVRLALDAASGAGLETQKARARVHVAGNPETLAVQWYDSQGHFLGAVPEGSAPAGAAALARQMVASPVSTARPVYGSVADGVVPTAMRVATPGGGVIVASLSLPIMLERHVPWWIAEQYAVSLFDNSGVLAERARRAVADGATSHAISFDPPLVGTVLQITAYDRPPAPGNTALLGAIVALAAFAIVALLVVQRNAQHRRAAEARLRAETAFRRAMEDSLTVGLRAKDHEGRILYVNAAFCRLVGLPAGALIGRRPPMPYWAPDALEETLARQRRLATGPAQPQSFESRFRRSDGSEIDVQVYEAPLIDAAGRHQGWMGSVIDITEARRAARLARAQDESLARTGRLVTLGEMASTLAHELNQPLGAIASYATGGLNLIDAGRGDPVLLKSALEKTAAQARRAGLIIRRIQDFVKKREPQLMPLDLTEVAQDAMGLLAGPAREMRVRLVLQTAGPDLPPVLADRILVEQVLVNLIRNGMEAMAEGPRSGDRLTIRITEEPGELRLDVIDRGPGIPPELEQRLYDPFNSTKSQGMGMGLNICRSILEMLRGSLAHAPNPDGGTIFTIRLPLAAVMMPVADDVAVAGDTR